MCFYKTKESKVLIAKRDIKVYKLGTYADNDSFNPFYYKDFKYPVNQTVFENVEFTNRIIGQGLHSYIMCKLAPFATAMDLFSCGNFLHPLRKMLSKSIIIIKNKEYDKRRRRCCIWRSYIDISNYSYYIRLYILINILLIINY